MSHVVLDKKGVIELPGAFKINVRKYTHLHLYLEVLQTIKQLLNMDYDYLQIIDGKSKTGVGKSSIALFGAVLIDPDFDLRKQLAFDDLKQVIKVIRHSKPGQAIILDEGGSALFSRDFATRENKLFNKVLMISRAKLTFLQVIAPSVFDLDKLVRRSLGSLISVKKRGVAEFYDREGLVEAWFPEIVTLAPPGYYYPRKPTPMFEFHWPNLKGWEVWEQYLELKHKYIDQRLDAWLDKLDEGLSAYKQYNIVKNLRDLANIAKPLNDWREDPRGPALNEDNLLLVPFDEMSKIAHDAGADIEKIRSTLKKLGIYQGSTRIKAKGKRQTLWILDPNAFDAATTT